MYIDEHHNISIVADDRQLTINCADGEFQLQVESNGNDAYIDLTHSEMLDLQRAITLAIDNY